jgi:hypothetical protein
MPFYLVDFSDSEDNNHIIDGDVGMIVRDDSH